MGLWGCPDCRSGMPGSSSTVIAHMEPPSLRKQAKRVRLGPKRTLLGAPDVLGEPRGADLVPTTPDWPAWVGFMVTTHFDLVSGPFHSPILSGCIVYQPLLTCTIFIRAPANYRVVHLVILAHMEPPRVRLGPKRPHFGAPDVLGEPRGGVSTSAIHVSS